MQLIPSLCGARSQQAFATIVAAAAQLQGSSGGSVAQRRRKHGRSKAFKLQHGGWEIGGAAGAGEAVAVFQRELCLAGCPQQCGGDEAAACDRLQREACAEARRLIE